MILLLKARKIIYPVGSVRKWKGGYFQKQANGDWKPVKKDGREHDQWRDNLDDLAYYVDDYVEGNTQASIRSGLIEVLKRVFPKGVPKELKFTGKAYRVWHVTYGDYEDYYKGKRKCRLDSRAKFTSFCDDFDALIRFCRKYSRALGPGTMIQTINVSESNCVVHLPKLIQWMKDHGVKRTPHHRRVSAEREVLVTLTGRSVPTSQWSHHFENGYIFGKTGRGTFKITGS